MSIRQYLCEYVILDVYDAKSEWVIKPYKAPGHPTLL